MLPGHRPVCRRRAGRDQGRQIRIRRRHGITGREKQRRNIGTRQLRRDPAARRPRSQPRVRNVQERRPRLLLRAAGADVGRGAQLSIRSSAACCRSGRFSTTIRRASQGIAMNTRRTPYNDIRVRKALTPPVQPRATGREADVQRVCARRFDFPEQRVREPRQRKDPLRPADGVKLLAEAGWKDRDASGRLVRRWPAADHRDHLRRSAVGALLHHLSGGSSQGRHHAEPSAGHVRDTGQAARRTDVRDGQHRLHGGAVSRARKPVLVASWPIRRTPTTSRASRTPTR